MKASIRHSARDRTRAGGGKEAGRARNDAPARGEADAGHGAGQVVARMGNRGLAALLGANPAQGPAAERAADLLAQRALQIPQVPPGSDGPPVHGHRQAAADAPPPPDAPAHVRAAVSTRGQSLDPELAERLGRAFDFDFGNVSIHRDAPAARSTGALGAHAYAVGRHVVFAPGQYAPRSPGGQALIAHELAHVVQQRHAGPRVQLKKAPAKSVPALTVNGATFEEAAANFAQLLQQHQESDKARIVIVNGPNVRVFDETGKPVVKTFFHLQSPVTVPVGVYRQTKGARLRPIIINEDGSYGIGHLNMEGTLNFAKDIDDQEGFNKALEGAKYIYYVSPNSTAVAATADAPAPVPIENLPEFMEFEAKSKANLPAWPSATLPLTSQLATVNSTGSFICKVDKNQGVNTLDRVTNLMQATRFRWEVLKLDETLRVKDKKRTTGWDAAAEGFARRKRQLKDDRQAMLGDRRRQSIPESVFRSAVESQTRNVRTALAMTGQAVMTVINAITGGPNQLTTEDVMDVPFKEQGDYFVRCLATQVVPKDAKYRRATSVSGVMVSVYDIEDVARESLSGGDELKADAEKNRAQVEAALADLDQEIASGEGDVVIKRSERAYKALMLGYFEDLAAAGSDPLNAKVAEQNLLRSQIAYFESDEYPPGEKYLAFKEAKLEKLRARLKILDAVIARMRGALSSRDSQIDPVGYMRAMLVDEVTSQRTELSFHVGERRYIAADKLEVVIADVTGATGRTFTGSASGFLGAGRQDAWLDAMTDLRRNLNRGRGWISYEVPKPYEKWKSELPNPMKLEMSIKAQLKETVDDAAHALTIAAILAAPLTGGSSLGILAVLAPIQAGSSLYNIVNRAVYDDLQVDEEAVFDLINIATLGLGKLSTVGKAGSRGLEIVASSSRIAIKLINGGQFIVISYQLFNTLMESQTDPDADPRELRRKKLTMLLNWFEQAAIPVSEKLFSEAHGPGKRPDKSSKGKDASLSFEEPLDVQGKPRKRTVKEGEFVEPAGKAPAKAAAPEPVAKAPGKAATPEATAATPAGDAAAAPAPAPAAVGYKPGKAQLRGVPGSLHGKVAVVEGMGTDARVVYKRGGNGLITDVQIQIGKGATAADVKTHAAVAELMLKYSGTGGRIRQLRDLFINLFKGPAAKRPQIGSRAWEARFELVKLDRMMRERHAELAAIADQPADRRDMARQNELMRDLDSLELQYQEHAAVFNAIEMGNALGRGYVAAEGLAAGERMRIERKLPPAPDGYRWRFRKGQLEVVAKPGREKIYYDEKQRKFVKDDRPYEPERFEPGTDALQAFRELGGYQADTPFGAFVEMLLDQGLVKSRKEVIDAIAEPGSRTYDTVRGKVKDVFKARLVEQITSPAYLKKTARYREVLKATGDPAQARRAAGMDEMLRLSERLGPEERGSLGERVYAELFGSGKSTVHVDISPAELAAAKGVPESAVAQGRTIDRMDGTRAREIKNVTTRLGPRERGQIEDMLAMVGQKVQPSGGAPRRIEQVSVAFLDPKGGIANASLAHQILSANPGAPLTFEFHATDGKVVKVTASNKDVLLKPDFRTKLGLPAL
ncbi:DUF4157 domain-containing protein [Pseudoxanthomonas suwonensis]|uniref:eCIS core domain-containing protein n=1 Tax=Pseudoxanthomonas suwonensis TaxID=314722 RepID=A0A0E3Z1J1_9GAMM|nr:DUF4157 domain-containing protein [Pseudoxanthomonas suwonensis]AKC86794.1 hypothetical protein WQ53_08520 [Pseudoxanthomonas suwonensis]